jgi:hypothetical protein
VRVIVRLRQEVTVVATQTRVLFLDGIGCNPTGYKPRFIAGLGYQVTAPMLPDLDFPAAVALADQAVTASKPDVIVGYSRGAAVAMMLQDRCLPRVLIAPALSRVDAARGFAGRLVVLHSATDDGLPLERVRAELTRCGLTGADLRVVGDDHTMIDQAALSALTAALRELTEVTADEQSGAPDGEGRHGDSES